MDTMSSLEQSLPTEPKEAAISILFTKGTLEQKPYKIRNPTRLAIVASIEALTLYPKKALID
jgi:hypothetical protein